jgi:hypothetical protein
MIFPPPSFRSFVTEIHPRQRGTWVHVRFWVGLSTGLSANSEVRIQSVERVGVTIGRRSGAVFEEEVGGAVFEWRVRFSLRLN